MARNCFVAKDRRSGVEVEWRGSRPRVIFLVKQGWFYCIKVYMKLFLVTLFSFPRIRIVPLGALCLLLFSAAAIANGQPRQSLTAVQTREAELRLSELGYWTGVVDGRFDAATRSALIAFQKWEGRTVTGKLTLNELSAIRNASLPKAREEGYAHVEVDLDRQVLLIVNNDESVQVLPISSGSGKSFVAESETSVAHTPRGRFLVYDKVDGWEKTPPNSMYYSNYISGGVAIHGSPNVPVQPASHGCIRIPIFAARKISKLLPVGTIVLVYDKVTFVSAKPWAENPSLKEAALHWNRSVDH